MPTAPNLPTSLRRCIFSFAAKIGDPSLGGGGGEESLTDSLDGGVPPLIDFVSHTILSKLSKLLSYHHRIRFLGKIIGTTNLPTSGDLHVSLI